MSAGVWERFTITERNTDPHSAPRWLVQGIQCAGQRNWFDRLDSALLAIREIIEARRERGGTGCFRIDVVLL